ncbi:hypothetical protein BH20ACI2_BH20ACI2_14420 [soil metagenome]
MYRRPKFLEILLEIRRQMALEADYDVDLFTEIARSGVRPQIAKRNTSGSSPRKERRDSTINPELTRTKES